jgi:hypothetical protein
MTHKEKMLAKKAARVAQAASLGIPVAELVRRNKAEAARIRAAANRRADLIETANVHLAEVRLRGLVLADDVAERLHRAGTRAGFREIGEDGVRELLKITTAAIEVAAFANASRLRDVALGIPERLQ